MTASKNTVSFEPLNPHNPDDVNVLLNGVPIGTLYIKRNQPKPGDIMLIVHDLEGNTFICPQDTQAVQWLVKGLENVNT